MSYKILRTGEAKSFTPNWFDNSNSPITLPENTTFSVFTTDPNIGTAVISDGVIVFTPQGSNTGNVYLNCVASLLTGQDVYATILLHVTDNTDETTDYGTISIA